MAWPCLVHRRTHIHAVHASSRHPWKERRNVALHLSMSVQLIPRPCPHFQTPPSKPQLHRMTSARFRGVFDIMKWSSSSRPGSREGTRSFPVVLPDVPSPGPPGGGSGPCTLVTSGVPSVLLLTALLHRAQCLSFPSLLQEPGRGGTVGCHSPACTHPPPQFGLPALGACQNSAPSQALGPCWAACDCLL